MTARAGLDIAKLSQVLERNQVPTRFYGFGSAGGGDCFGVERAGPGWVLTYYDDRGTREETAVFETEDEACRALFDRMRDLVLSTQARLIVMDAPTGCRQ